MTLELTLFDLQSHADEQPVRLEAVELLPDLAALPSSGEIPSFSLAGCQILYTGKIRSASAYVWHGSSYRLGSLITLVRPVSKQTVRDAGGLNGGEGKVR